MRPSPAALSPGGPPTPVSSTAVPPAVAGGPADGGTAAERIARFYAAHPGGRIITELVTRAREVAVFRAAVYRGADDARPAATGWAAAGCGLGAPFERAEEAAVGRALAHLGVAPASGGGRPVRLTVGGAAEPPDAADGRDVLAADLALLVARAERYGLRPRRAARWRERLRTGADAPAALQAAERRLRAWVERRRAEPYAGAV